MWECKQCGYKNNNSSQSCHGEKCKAMREFEAIEIPKKIIKIREVKKVYDYCPKCTKDTFWTSDRFKGRKAWRCVECKSLAFLKGKSKPLPEEVLT